jgi:hypothetical protein
MKWGIVLAGVATALTPVGRLTGATGSSSWHDGETPEPAAPGWPTPTANEKLGKDATPGMGNREGRAPGNLLEALAREQYWPDLSPGTAGRAPDDWPTPRASEHHQGEETTQATIQAMREGYSGAWRGAARGETLSTRVDAVERLEWPTPQAHDVHAGKAARVGHYGTEHGGRNLNDDVALAEHTALWPSPRATDGAKGGPHQRGSKGDLMLPSAVRQSASWPTAAASDHKTTSRAGQRRGQLADALHRIPQWATPKSSPSGPDYARVHPVDSGGDDLATQMARQEGGAARGQTSSLLNQAWVEMLMGFPEGWLDGEVDEEARLACVLTPRWPAPPGHDQHDWEAPRTVSGHRPARVAALRSLGNACVPAQAFVVFAAIMEIEREEVP